MAESKSPQNPDPTPQPDETFDGAVEADIDMDIRPEDQVDGAAEAPATAPATEVPAPTKKDISLRDFLSKMDDYAPIIPDAVTQHHLLLAGLPPSTTPLPLSRLLALATQKFIADIAADAYQYSRMRSSASTSTATAAATALGPGGAQAGQQGGGGGGGGGDKGKGGAGNQHVLGVQRAGYGGGGSGGGQGRAVLTMEDLGCAVGEYGVNVKRGEFYR